MDYSNDIFNYIQSTEGYSSTVYADSGGILTAGYGHTGPDVDALGVGASIDTKQAVDWLKSDMQKSADMVNNLMQYSGVSLNQNQFDALVSFEYNTGALTANETIWQDIVNQTDPQVIDAWWKKHYITDSKGNSLAGLQTRRDYEANLFITPVSTTQAITDTLKKKS